jgi:ABC-2 type transport system permease protein
VRRVLAQARKEVMHFQRDRLTVALSVLMPLVMVWIFGVTLALDPDNIRLVIEDLDHTPASRNYVDAYVSGAEFIVVPGVIGARPEAALDAGLATAVLIIPPGFERRLLSQRGGGVQMLLDASDANTALIVKQEAEAIHQWFMSANRASVPVPIGMDVRFWYNPGLSDRIYSGTGALAMVLIFFPALLGATATSREHELGNVIHVYASALSAHEWALGKALPHIVIGLLQFVLCFALGAVWFSYRVPTNPAPLLLGTLCYVTVGVLFGMWVGTATRSQSASIQIVQLGVFLLSLLLSGFLTPVASIPLKLRWVSYMIPATYYVDLVRDALLRNAGWETTWLAILILGAMALTLYGMIILQTRRMRFAD